MGDPVVFEKGVHVHKRGNVTVELRVPHDVRLSQMMPALVELEMAKEAGDEARQGEGDAA